MVNDCTEASATDKLTDELCTCVLAVLQKNRRQMRKYGLDNLSIGFAVYEVPKFQNKPKIESLFRPVVRPAHSTRASSGAIRRVLVRLCSSTCVR